MKKYISILLAAVLVLACLSACGTSDKPADADNSEKLSVVTTIFPQYDFTRQIVGDKADVTMLLKPGAESHSYEPTPQDIKTIQNCDLFIYTGGENDVWVDDILNSMGDQRPDTLRLIDCVPTVNEEIVEGMEHEHDHDHGEIVESEIKDRPLSDFAGDFQSVLPYFEDGTLDEYITEEAEENEKSFDEMKQEFLEKRKSDYNTLSIEGNSVSFHTPSGTVSAEYEYQGFQTVKDDDGDITSVWYTFQAKTPDSGAPVYLAFNDHGTGAGSHEEEHEEHEEEIAHFHLRYGNESVEALMDVENWAPTFYAADATADEIKEATGGAVLIEVYPQSQLGVAVVMLDGLSNGTLEMAMVGCNEIATMLPDFYAFCLPFLFSDIDEFINVARDPEVSAKANEIMNSKGITLIGFSSGESRGYSNTQHTVRTPADIAGQKVRIQAGTIYVDTFEALGAVPSTMAFSEVYSALQQGVVDAEDNGADMLTKMKFAEVEKYHTVLNHMIQSNPLLISTEVWNRLSPEQQDAIKTAEANWGDGYLDFIHEQLDASIQSAEEAGVEITELTDAEFQAFKDATSSVYDTYVPQIDPAVYELVCNKIDALRG